MKIRLLFILLICFQVQAQIHPDLKPYHDRFIAEAKARGMNTMPVGAPSKIQFFNNGKTDIHGGVLFPLKEIYINQLYWNSATENEKEKTVFHELAHYYYHRGHIRHCEDIMDPNATLHDYTLYRNLYIDNIFRKIYESSPIEERRNMQIRNGDLMICSDNDDSETFRVYVMKEGSPEIAARSMAILDSIQKTHTQYDWISRKCWPGRFQTFHYKGMEPVIQADERIEYVWGEMSRMYMFAHDERKAPKLVHGLILGMYARGRWTEGNEMTLVVDGKTTTLNITRPVNILYFVKYAPSLSEGKSMLNLN